MGKIVLFLIISMCLNAQKSLNSKFLDSDFDTDTKVFQTILEIDSLVIGSDFRVEKQYLIKTLLKKISFYEKMIDEVNNQKDSNIRKGLIKSIINSDEDLDKVIKETDSNYEISQTLKGTMNALRRFAVLNMWQEYKHFLNIKENFSH